MIESEAQYAELMRKRTEMMGGHAAWSEVGGGPWCLAYQMATLIKNHIKTIDEELSEYDARVYPRRVGPWWQTFSNRGRFWPLSPHPEDFHIEDIAHALARIPRFNAQTREAYSVAQHSFYVSQNVEPRFALAGLMHDASEAYLQDIVSPIKRMIKADYEPIEAGVMGAIAERFGFSLEPAAKAAVKRADLALLATEVRDLIPGGFINSDLPVPPLPMKIERCWKADWAEMIFTERFGELTDGLNQIRIIPV